MMSNNFQVSISHFLLEFTRIFSPSNLPADQLKFLSKNYYIQTKNLCLKMFFFLFGKDYLILVGKLHNSYKLLFHWAVNSTPIRGENIIPTQSHHGQRTVYYLEKKLFPKPFRMFFIERFSKQCGRFSTAFLYSWKFTSKVRSTFALYKETTDRAITAQ